MKQAILGYWNILKTQGISRAIWSFYSYYYTKYKLKKINFNEDLFVNTHGSKLKVIPNDSGLSTELLVFGAHEPDTTKFISQYLKKNMICLDIGANIGYYSTLYSKIIGNKGKVISVEPSPLNFEYLEKNLELENPYNYLAFNCACGGKDEIVNFQLDSRANKCNVIKNEDIISSNLNIIKVPVKKLDSIVSETGIDKLDFIKIDVEGYEWNTLQGAKTTIHKFKPTIQIELHLKKIGHKITHKILEFFSNEGYDVIYHDIGGDEGSWTSKKKKMNYSLSNLVDLDIIEKYQNSFKLILEYMK